MPYEKRELALLSNWTRGKHFDPEEDRLLVTTSWDDSFVIRQKQGIESITAFVVDSDFMPENLAAIPSELAFIRNPPIIHRESMLSPWYIHVFDGEITSDGVKPAMIAVSPGRWTRSITTSSLVFESITPMRKRDINATHFADSIQGFHFEDFVFNNQATPLAGMRA